MLRVNNVEVVYSNVILVLRGVSLSVPEGKIVALLGANGSGKTTTLRSISGLLRSQDGEITRGTIEYASERIDRMAPEEIVQRGIVQILEGRRLFQHLTVEENLVIGSVASGSTSTSAGIQRDLDQVYAYFPALGKMRRRTSGFLSGGEQQMLVIGRALMAHPKLMLLDEPSLGLAPILVAEIFKVIERLRDEEGLSILLVEQNAHLALQAADYAYVMDNGRIVLDGPAAQLVQNEDIKEFYLGLTRLGERKSYREVKHYKRRKRWLG
ncbi:MAG TPA: ABC transporter ATP-binding protein [Anaerolineales bacterium]|nr:ABC transporter ATP-binding protein [Anaerolineales bacterium]